MSISAADVKTLREATGAGMMECKNALTEVGGDLEKAKDLLRERGLASAKKFADRAADEGMIYAYLHRPAPEMPAKVGVLIELNCATDFVAKTEAFQKLAHEVALHISFANPSFLNRDEVPAETVAREKEIFAKQAEGKPPAVVEKMVNGKLDAFFADQCLLDQKYIRDDSKTIAQLLDQASGELKEPVRVRRFSYFRVGN